MVGVGTFIGFEFKLRVMIISGNFGSEFGFLHCIVDDFVRLTNPTASGFIRLVHI